MINKDNEYKSPEEKLEIVFEELKNGDRVFLLKDDKHVVPHGVGEANYIIENESEKGLAKIVTADEVLEMDGEDSEVVVGEFVQKLANRMATE